MTADTGLYCIKTYAATATNPFLDTGGGGQQTYALPLPGLFDTAGTIPTLNPNIGTNNLFGIMPPLSGMSYDQFGMTPAFTGDIFNMPVEMPNIGLCNQMFTNIMAGFQQQMMNMQMQFMNGMGGMNPYSDEDTSYFSYDAQALKSKWSKAKRPKEAPPLTDGFYNKVVEISKRIGCDPNDLMGIMYSESRLDPTVVNGIGATGLIQFIPSTARSLGTTTAALKRMSPEEQLVYVEKCFMASKKQAGIPANQKVGKGTLYALIFMPARAGRNVLAQQGEIYYDGKNGKNGNQSLDLNGDGSITKDELAMQVNKMIREGTGSLA